MTPILGIIASSFRSAAGPDGAYDALSTITVPSGGLASITFAAIPNTYKHLQIRGIAKSNRAVYVDDLGMRFNSDTATNYSSHRLYGDGASATSDAESTRNRMNIAQIAGGTVNNSSGFGGLVIDVLDYASTIKSKTVRVLSGYDDNGQGLIEFASGAWYNSSTAVNSITFLPLFGTSISEKSQFTLYGVK
jgi:hypothetical protein